MIATIITIIIPIIIRILIIYSNSNSDSYNENENLTIIIIKMRIVITIIHHFMLYLLRIEFYSFSIYSILDIISHINSLKNI